MLTNFQNEVNMIAFYDNSVANSTKDKDVLGIFRYAMQAAQKPK